MSDATGEQGDLQPAADAVPEASVTIIEADNLVALATLQDASFQLIYLDPPFNTGRAQKKQVESALRRPCSASRLIAWSSLSKSS